MDIDKNGNQLQTFTYLMPCTPVGQKGSQCPAGWESVGYTPVGSCTIGNVPGDGTQDAWKMYGYKRVCKRKIPTSGDLGTDCCSNLFGINNSIECKSRGFQPYSWTCNNIMVNRCNTNVQKNPFAPEWDGMPKGQDKVVYDGCMSCIGNIRCPSQEKKAGCVDEFCVNYLRNAPPNNFFHDHDYQDYLHHFPRHSYATPKFNGTWGYQPMRTPYLPYTDFNNKLASNYCLQSPRECWNTTLNDYHF